MIKVAGKRASLQELTRQILALPGVEDAVVFLPDDDARPAAAVVAPGLTAAAILRELRTRLDGVFVPRPLVIVDELPRNSVGKLPREELLRPAGEGAPMNDAVTSEFVVPADHPSLAGHFPGPAGGAGGGVARRGAGGDPDARGPRAAIDSRARNSCSPCCRTNASTCASSSPPSTPTQLRASFQGLRATAAGLRGIVHRVGGFSTMNDWRSHKERSTPSMVRLIVRLATHLRRPVVRPLLYPIVAYFLLTSPAARDASRDYLRRVLGRSPRVARPVAALLRVCELHARSHLPAVQTPCNPSRSTSTARKRCAPPLRARPAACCSSRISAAPNPCA